MIANIVLQLVTQAQSQGKIWTQLPIILREDSEVVLINPRFRLARKAFAIPTYDRGPVLTPHAGAAVAARAGDVSDGALSAQ